MNYCKLTVMCLFIVTLPFSCKEATGLPVSLSSATLIPLKESAPQRKKAAEPTGKTVWICQSAAAKRYHYNASCRGLKRCTHTVLKTTVERAKAVGLTMCGFEK